MKYKIKEFMDSKQFHICMIIIIVFFIIFTVGVISLIYNVEGEMNLPFELSKISVVSSIEGTDVEDANNKWNLKVDQCNDFYLYIKRNEYYKKETETIKSVVIDNFEIQKEPNIGNLKLFKPDSNTQNSIFKNIDVNEIDKIEYQGSTESSIKDLKIANQGGLVVFRYAISNIGNYISNEDIEINHSELIKKIAVNNEDLKFKVKFNISINLDSNKSYKTDFEVELPIRDIVNEGMQSQEYTELENMIFKRK